MDYVPGSRSEGVYFRSERKDQLIAGLHTEEVTQTQSRRTSSSARWTSRPSSAS